MAGTGLLNCEERMRPTYRRRAEKFRGIIWRCCFCAMSEADSKRKWRGGGNHTIRPLCKQFKQDATPDPVKILRPLAGIDVALLGG